MSPSSAKDKTGEHSGHLHVRIHEYLDRFLDDPLPSLGPGIISYHKLLNMLFALFILLTLLHLPSISNNLNGTFYDDPEDGIVLQSSLGNLGFSETKCQGFSMVKDHVGTL